MFVENERHIGWAYLFRSILMRLDCTGLRECLVDILDEVRDVLDADRQAEGYGLGSHVLPDVVQYSSIDNLLDRPRQDIII